MKKTIKQSMTEYLEVELAHAEKMWNLASTKMVTADVKDTLPGDMMELYASVRYWEGRVDSLKNMFFELR